MNCGNELMSGDRENRDCRDHVCIHERARRADARMWPLYCHYVALELSWERDLDGRKAGAPSL